MAELQPADSGKKRNLITMMLCAGSVIMNLMLSALCSKLGLPIWLDTVGTVVTAAMGGSLPGVIVGFATNMFKSISDPSALYYGFLNVLIALASAWIAKKRFRSRIVVFSAAVGCFSLIGGGIGTLIPWFLDGVSLETEPLTKYLFSTGFFSPYMAQLTANLLTEMLDKSITVMLSVGIMVLLPEKVRRLFRFSGWMQTPLSSEESASAKQMSFRVMSLRTKILLVLSISLIAVSVAATGISMRLYRNALIKDHTKVAIGTANIAASVLNPDMIDTYLADGAAAEGYAETEQLLYEIRESSVDILYLYVYRIEDDGCHVVFDLDTDEVKGSPVGDVIPFDPTLESYLPDLLAGRQIEPIESNGFFGWLLKVFVPVYNDAGKCVCYAAADVPMKQIGIIERNFFVEMLALFLGFFVLIFSFVRWLVEYHIILPVNSIAMSTDTFAYDSEKARESSIERIRELEIRTGDEVENLYHAIVKTSDDSMRYVADVQRKNEEISRMQEALILVLADIVESRDRNTGAHVRKTAAYTDLILKEMRNKGYYADALTDGFISDVVNSAPLHDVGKIQVPDAILNKPGKLSDEEFTIMKTHTTAGQNILSEAIKLVPNSGYLNEARNLAAYHHEKWDGSGYPTGLAGEDIPLSARVMAVADVFDALVSKRSYKKSFTFEEAMQIIKEGSGKHFDPLIVDAFVSAEDEVQMIEAEFSRRTNEAGWLEKADNRRNECTS
ncbi:MAG: HD domain-containing protein [Oscillospiraceae bacterium]|nr:HD domain-containing protein [Oscillospiraceae bacterium]